MRFLVDEQLPPGLALWLKGYGHDAVHVRWKGLASSSDETIWRLAMDLKAIVVTKDEDFVQMRRSRGVGPQILWVRAGNTRKAVLLEAFAQTLPRVTEALARGDAIVEI